MGLAIIGAFVVFDLCAPDSTPYHLEFKKD
jgi:hypothetical protein